MKKAPEQYRLKNHPLLGSDSSYENNGFFIIPHERIAGYHYNCQISDGKGWEHVSVTLTSDSRKVERCCTWQEMCYVKDLFFEETESAMQLHPPKSEYVSTHPYCLHLWRPLNAEIPLPPSIFVGVKGDNIQSFK